MALTAEERRMQQRYQPVATPRSNSAALRGRRGSATPVAPTYTPWTGGGDSRFITAPGDSTIEYGVGRTTSTPSGGGGGSRDIPAIEPPPPSRGTPQPLDFRDSSYNAQIAAIERALRDFETGSTRRGERYQEDFSTGLGRLGFRPAPQPMMAARSMEGEPAEGAAVGFDIGKLQGEFDIEGETDRTSAAARGTRGMRDEFAGRGTLRSSDFAKSFEDFQNRLQQQLTGMETGRTRFGEDLQTELAQFQARTQEQRQSAQDAATNRALMRQLSQMGF